MEEFKPGDRIEVFTSPGTWMAVEVYAVGPDWYVVGNGDPIYSNSCGPDCVNDGIRSSFRVHKNDARAIDPWEIGDVVAVLAADGSDAYFGEIWGLPEGEQTKFGIFNPETGEVHYVAEASGEGFRRATDAENDAYIERWVDPEMEDSNLDRDVLFGPEE
jgi:hypothetical protein